VVHDTRWRNGQKGTIKGAELAGQFAFDTGSAARGFGVAANYTYVDAQPRCATTVPPVQLRLSGPVAPVVQRLGVLREQPFQVRASYNWRSHFSPAAMAAAQLPTRVAAYGQTDASLRYNLTPTISLYLDIINADECEEARVCGQRNPVHDAGKRRTPLQRYRREDAF
jgi:iron complex outermembrane receptor protein